MDGALRPKRQPSLADSLAVSRDPTRSHFGPAYRLVWEPEAIGHFLDLTAEPILDAGLAHRPPKCLKDDRAR